MKEQNEQAAVLTKKVTYFPTKSSLTVKSKSLELLLEEIE